MPLGAYDETAIESRPYGRLVEFAQAYLEQHAMNLHRERVMVAASVPGNGLTKDFAAPTLDHD